MRAILSRWVLGVALGLLSIRSLPAGPDEPTEILGHEDEVGTLAFAPAGTLLASGSADKTIRLWDAATGASGATLKGHTSLVYSVAFRADGQRLVSTSVDMTCRVWDVASGQELAVYKGHQQIPYAAAFSPDGKRVASVSDDETIAIWNAETGQEEARLHERAAVWSVDWSPDGTRVAAAVVGSARLWNVAQKKLLKTFGDHAGEVGDVLFSPDGTLIYTSSYDATVKIWNVASGAEIRTLEGHQAEVTGMALGPGGRTLVTSSDDRTIRIWNPADGTCLRTIATGDEEGTLSIAISADGQLLASGQRRKGSIKVWRVQEK